MRTNLFDNKETKDLLKYNGRDDMELWYRKTTDYLVSRAPDILQVLTMEIQNENLAHDPELLQMGRTGELPTKPDVLSHHLWGFLASNLEGQAWEKFGSCERQHGFEAWRRVVQNHVSKTPAERLQLESAALSPPTCSRHQDVEAAILTWEYTVKKYHESLARGIPREALRSPADQRADAAPAHRYTRKGSVGQGRVRGKGYIMCLQVPDVYLEKGHLGVHLHGVMCLQYSSRKSLSFRG